MNLVRLAMLNYYRTRQPEIDSAANRSMHSIQVEVPYRALKELGVLMRDTTNRVCWVQISLNKQSLVSISGDVHSGCHNAPVDHNWGS